MRDKIEFMRENGMFKCELDCLGFSLFSQPLLRKYNAHFRAEHSLFPGYHNRLYIAERLNLNVLKMTMKVPFHRRVWHRKKEQIDEVISVLLGIAFTHSITINFILEHFLL